jgi:hypothetical protein
VYGDFAYVIEKIGVLEKISLPGAQLLYFATPE